MSGDEFDPLAAPGWIAVLIIVLMVAFLVVAGYTLVQFASKVS